MKKFFSTIFIFFFFFLFSVSDVFGADTLVIEQATVNLATGFSNSCQKIDTSALSNITKVDFYIYSSGSGNMNIYLRSECASGNYVTKALTNPAGGWYEWTFAEQDVSGDSDGYTWLCFTTTSSNKSITGVYNNQYAGGHVHNWSSCSNYAGSTVYDFAFRVYENQGACGDSVITPPEECDEGDTDNYDGCSSTCQIETSVCGNGYLENYALGYATSTEECDDGNTTSYDGCHEDCTTELSKYVNFQSNNFYEDTLTSAGAYFSPFKLFISFLVGIYLALFVVALFIKRIL